MNNNIYTGDFFVYRQFVYMIIKYKTEKNNIAEKLYPAV